MCFFCRCSDRFLSKVSSRDTPQYYEFMNPTLQGLREGGGTLTNEEIVDAVTRIMDLPDEVMERQQAGHQNVGEVAYRIAWAKSYLKQGGYLTQSARGVWALTPEGKIVETVDERSIVAKVRKAYQARRKVKQETQQTEEQLDATEEPNAEELAEIEEELGWKEQVLDAVLAMSPDAFERLSQRLLRECGFSQVEVTGRSGDGGVFCRGHFSWLYTFL